jgi:hypothetical protein
MAACCSAASESLSRVKMNLAPASRSRLFFSSSSLSVMPAKPYGLPAARASSASLRPARPGPEPWREKSHAARAASCSGPVLAILSFGNRAISMASTPAESTLGPQGDRGAGMVSFQQGQHARGVGNVADVHRLPRRAQQDAGW